MTRQVRRVMPVLTVADDVAAARDAYVQSMC